MTSFTEHTRKGKIKGTENRSVVGLEVEEVIDYKGVSCENYWGVMELFCILSLVAAICLYAFI